MEQSLFIEWVEKYFPGVVIRTVETLNDTQRAQTYLFKRMLRVEYSVTGEWETLSGSFALVAADFISMDSSLPLKMRDTFGKASGDIPKQGIEFYLNEKQLSELDVLVAQNAPESAIVGKLFRDTAKCIGGIFENNELAFLQGLSTGVTVVLDTDRPGIGIRLDFKYRAANKFGVSTLWSDAGSKPFDDFLRVVNKAKADGNGIILAQTDSATIDDICKTQQAKELYAFTQNFVGQQIPNLDLDQLNALTKKRYGFVFEVIDRAVKIEKNGSRSTITPWAAGAVVFTCTPIIGVLAWAKLAEMNHPVDGVTYETAEEYILVSKYRQNKPSLSEWTNAQARVVPVIANVDEIYLLDSKTVQA